MTGMAVEFGHALLFFLFAVLFGAIGLPVSYRVTRDRRAAAALAVITGWAGFGYVVWLCASLELVSARNMAVWRTTLAVAAAGGVAWVLRRGERVLLSAWLRQQGWALLIYVIFLWIRAHHADALSGGEKMMDLALVASIAKTDQFPFADMWWAALPINYYYFGQFLVALVGSLSGVTPTLAYNCGLGWMLSVSAPLAYHLMRGLGVGRSTAAAGTLLALGGGGIVYTWQCVKAWSAGQAIPVWHSAVQFYEELRQENPGFSFLAGDLHAHMIAIAFLLAALILLGIECREGRPRTAVSGLFAFLTAVSILISAWNGITVALLYGLVLLRRWRTVEWWKHGLAQGAVILALLAPFLAHFRSPATGLGFAPAFAASHGGFRTWPTPAWMTANWGIWLVVGAWCAWRLRQRIRGQAPMWVVFLAGGGLLMAGVEIVFIKDLYHHTHPAWFRSNTFFKFGVHVWILLSLGMCVGLEAAVKSSRVRAAWLAGISLHGAVFPAAAIGQFYGVGSKACSTSVLSLDAMAAIRVFYGDAAGAAEWLRGNEAQRKVVVEAACASYVLCGLVAAYSGMRNPIQWKAHEWGWRQTEKDWRQVLERIEDLERAVRDLYQETELAATERLLRQLKADYVFVGDLERQYYGQIEESRFTRLGSLVYGGSHGRLYRIQSR